MKLFPALLLATAAAFAQVPPAAAPAKPARVVPPARINDFKADKTAVQAGQQMDRMHLESCTENGIFIHIAANCAQ